MSSCESECDLAYCNTDSITTGHCAGCSLSQDCNPPARSSSRNPFILSTAGIWIALLLFVHLAAQASSLRKINISCSARAALLHCGCEISCSMRCLTNARSSWPRVSSFLPRSTPMPSIIFIKAKNMSGLVQ